MTSLSAPPSSFLPAVRQYDRHGIETRCSILLWVRSQYQPTRLCPEIQPLVDHFKYTIRNCQYILSEKHFQTLQFLLPSSTYTEKFNMVVVYHRHHSSHGPQNLLVTSIFSVPGNFPLLPQSPAQHLFPHHHPLPQPARGSSHFQT